MPIPDSFCWTRFGTEAAQSIEQILVRKEEERVANGGMFFWGIGNAVGPSMKELIRRNSSPEVLFSPIKSTARPADVAPPAVVAWTSGETLSGDLFRLPDQSLITSRFDPDSPRGSHYALVCSSDRPLRISYSEERIAFAELRNLLTGRPIGASQVTSIVERVGAADGTSKMYEVSIRARLVSPFLIRLQDPLPLTLSPEGLVKTPNWADSVRELWERRLLIGQQRLAF